MKRKTKHGLAEWAKAATGILAGILFLLALETAWVLDNCIVSKSEAQASRERGQMYDRIACNPFDEMNGDGP